MTGNFTSFPTVFQSYQNEKVLMNGSCAIEPCLERLPQTAGLKLMSAKITRQVLTVTHLATRAPLGLKFC